MQKAQVDFKSKAVRKPNALTYNALGIISISISRYTPEKEERQVSQNWALGAQQELMKGRKE